MVAGLACWLATLVAVAAPASAAGGSPGRPVPVSPVVNARPQSIAEAAAVTVPRGTVVVATNGLVPGPASITAWHQRRGATGWSTGVAVRPIAYSASYDPGLAALPDGSVALVGVATVGGSGACLPQSSVYLARTAPGSLAFGAPVLVDDRRSGGGFDDRPIVAAGPTGRLWVGWSHGSDADQCQVVGGSDRIQLSTSENGGRSFSPPVTLPSLTGGAAYGVQVAPLGGGRAAVSWSELAGGQVTVVSCLIRAGAAGTTCAPRAVATATALPSVLPGASFFSFSLASLVAFHHGSDLALAWPVWQAGQGEVVMAVSLDHGRSWSAPTTVTPGPGADLLLPALAADGSDRLRLLVADHQRTGDVLGYQTLVATVSPSTGAVALAPAATVVAGRSGPGYLELGEFSFLSTSAHHVVGAVVEGGSANATLDLLDWPVPPRSAGPAPAPATTSSGTAAATPRGSRHQLLDDALVAVLGVLGLALAVGVVRSRQPATTRGPGPAREPARDRGAGRPRAPAADRGRGQPRAPSTARGSSRGPAPLGTRRGGRHRRRWSRPYRDADLGLRADGRLVSGAERQVEGRNLPLSGRR